METLATAFKDLGLLMFFKPEQYWANPGLVHVLRGSKYINIDIEVCFIILDLF
jgi:hypothetical protein